MKCPSRAAAIPPAISLRSAAIPSCDLSPLYPLLRPQGFAGIAAHPAGAGGWGRMIVDIRLSGARAPAALRFPGE
jgi:hypothetical protein